MSKNLADLRRDYSFESLTEQEARKDPISQFSIWWQEAIDAKIDEANAMTLATAAGDGVPSARVVLLKEYSEEGFVFFTNYNSYKGQQIAENPKACLLFFWKELERQVRIIGIITKVSDQVNDDYFQSRPEASRIGALVSPQSSVIEGRDWLDQRFNDKVRELEGKFIPRPAHWGGYIVKPVIMEFWQGRPSRLHDRLQYTLDEDGGWKMERLAP
ncbi:MAG: pyridoxamine 5'-phosphate oxidase [Chitinophagales bacterium]|nr:pyridoxamine 5'-phosphate oxidase [Chitinophagales bacterium]